MIRGLRPSVLPVVSLLVAVVVGTLFGPPALAQTGVGPPTDTDLDHATYIAEVGDDRAVGVVAGPAGQLVLARVGPDGRGVIEWRDPSGATLLATDTVGHAATDLASGAGLIVVAGPSGSLDVPGGVTALTGPGQVAWSRPWSQGADVRVDVGAAGTTAVLGGSVLSVLDVAGVPLGERVLDGDVHTDVAVNDARGVVYTTGFDNRRNGNPVQVARLHARRVSDLETIWRTWNHDPGTLDADMADTRAYRVVVAPDGAVVVAGESAGGNSIFRWDGQTLGERTNVRTDAYDDPYDTGSAHLGYLAVVDPDSGVVQRGAFLFSRLLSTSRGNTLRFRDGAITVAGDGTIWAAATAACCIPGRDQLLVEGETVGAYAGEDLVLSALTPDLTSRLLWTAFSREVGRGVTGGVAVVGDRIALAATSTGGQLITTADAAQPSAIDPWEDDGAADAWLMTLTPSWTAIDDVDGAGRVPSHFSRLD